MEINAEKQDDLVILTMPATTRELTEEAADQAKKELTRLIEDKAVSKVLIDVSRMEYGGTLMLTLLVHAYLKAKKRHKKLRFCNFHPFVIEVLEKTHLCRLFEVYESGEDALRNF